MRRLLLMMVILLLPLPILAEESGDFCEPFFQALLQVPHSSLERRDGPFTSQWSRQCVDGCLVVMKTDHARLDDQLLTDLSGDPGTPLYQNGWRSNPSLTADGAGTGMVGLEKDGVLCLVFTEQPAFVAGDGGFVQSQSILVRVECPISSLSDGPCPGDEECAGSCK